MGLKSRFRPLFALFSAFVIQIPARAATEYPILAGGPAWRLHGTLAVFAFGTLFMGMVIARRKPGPWWLKAHRALAFLGVLAILAAVAVAGYMVQTSTGKHLAYPHAYLGSLVLIMVLLTPTLGLLSLHWSSRGRKIRRVHRWSGRLTLLLAAFNILAGIWLVVIIQG